MNGRTVLTNARIGTSLDLRAIVIDGRDIAAVLPMVDVPLGRVVDLGGRTVLPGIDDAHLHAYEYGRALTAIPLGGADSLDDLRAGLAAATPEASGWYRGQGWTPAVRGSGAEGQLTATDIDNVTPKGPALLGDFSGHVAVANSTALRVAGIDASTPDPSGGVIVRDIHGHPTGLLLESAVGLVAGSMPPLPQAERTAAIQAAQDDLLRRGIISVTEPGLGPGGTTLMDGTGTLEAIDAYRELDARGALALRTHVMLLFGGLGGTTAEAVTAGLDAWGPPARSDRRHRLSVDQLKVFADGIPRSRTSWLSEPYDDCTHGHMTVAGDTDDERVAELHAIIAAAAIRGWQVGTHATGDATVRAVIDAVEQTRTPHLRHYVIHGDLIRHSDLPRMAALSMGLTSQPGIRWAVGNAVSLLLGRERNLGKQPLRSALDAGIPLTLSSDAPVIEPDWQHTIACAVTRAVRDDPTYTDSESIGIDEAITSMSSSAAWQCHEEAWRGRLATGMAADLLVLDREIDWVDLDSLRAARPEAVVIDGAVAYGSLGP